MDTKAAHVLGRYILTAGLAVAAVPPLLGWALPGASGPRYQATAAGSGNAYIVDTHTGQTWSRLTLGHTGHSNWAKDQSLGEAAK
jgi:hypothetical protein